MLWQGVEIVCPRCRGPLEAEGAALELAASGTLHCRACAAAYPVILGIPDLRVFPDPYIDLEADRAKGRRLAERFGEFDFSGFIDFYYSITDVVPADDAARFKRGLLGAGARSQASLQAWEAEVPGPKRDLALLDVGCGTAPLLAGLGPSYGTRVGVDIAFRWLVVAKKRLEESGRPAPLLCACAEALPFADARFDRVVADSTLEHLRDQRAAMGEINRVLRPGSALFVTTPNRFSVGPDPHLGVPGLSWFPERTVRWVARRKGAIPPHRRLLSQAGLRRLFAEAGLVEARVFVPDVPPEQAARFSGVMRAAIGAYRLARRLPVSRSLLHLMGPLLSAVARKPGAPEVARAA